MRNYKLKIVVVSLVLSNLWTGSLALAETKPAVGLCIDKATFMSNMAKRIAWDTEILTEIKTEIKSQVSMLDMCLMNLTNNKVGIAGAATGAAADITKGNGTKSALAPWGLLADTLSTGTDNVCECSISSGDIPANQKNSATGPQSYLAASLGSGAENEASASECVLIAQAKPGCEVTPGKPFSSKVAVLGSSNLPKACVNMLSKEYGVPPEKIRNTGKNIQNVLDGMFEDCDWKAARAGQPGYPDDSNKCTVAIFNKTQWDTFKESPYVTGFQLKQATYCAYKEKTKEVPKLQAKMGNIITCKNPEKAAEVAGLFDIQGVESSAYKHQLALNCGVAGFGTAQVAKNPKENFAVKMNTDKAPLATLLVSKEEMLAGKNKPVEAPAVVAPRPTEEVAAAPKVIQQQQQPQMSHSGAPSISGMLPPGYSDTRPAPSVVYSEPVPAPATLAPAPTVVTPAPAVVPAAQPTYYVQPQYYSTPQYYSAPTRRGRRR